jgi:hypothetical protein
MYLSILALPMFGSAVGGLFGRKIGVTGAHIITTGCLTLSALLSVVAFYEVGLCGSPVSIELFSWIDSEFMLVQWGFLFDSLTVSMLLPVLIVSSLVHLYSISYMAEDPHNQRFFSYLSMFTFFMLILVAGDNYFIMFIGWEGIGISSYLLINFWYTRIQANKSGIKALTVNRVGDMFLSVGFFAIFWVFGNVDYATVFSVVPYINESAITIIGLLLLVGAMAKSAQIGLHTWLPDAMEGKGKYIIYGLSLMILIMSVMLVFKYWCTSLEALDMMALPPILAALPSNTLHTITGNMLGDGSIRYNNMARNKGVPKGNCRYSMTMGAKTLNYIKSLVNGVYAPYCSSSINSYPNPNSPNYTGTATQYSFSTMSLPLFTALHQLWYQYNEKLGAFVKVVPLNIGEMFSPISLAHWIMEDGYFDGYGRAQTVILCTECFTPVECKLLQEVLLKLGIVSTLKVRNSVKGTYRIRISKSSMPLLRELVTSHMHPDFMYKLGSL